MASPAGSSPMVNGDLSPGVAPPPGPLLGQAPPSSAPGGQTGLEETLQQMNILIQENRELKEALHGTNLTMKERFEELSSWKERQREERLFLERKLEEARGRVDALTKRTQELGGGAREEEEEEGPAGPAANQSAELEALRSQVRRLQAEKADLVAMNSELQLKTGQGSPDDSFIEIRIADDGGMCGLKEGSGAEQEPRLDMTASRQESEELTVSQLLQSLRTESQRVGRLQIDLQASRARITTLEERVSGTDGSTQTSLTPEAPPTAAATQTEHTAHPEDSGKEKAVSEVETLKGQTVALFSELQQAQSRLDHAEHMKTTLQARVRELDQEACTLRAQLGEKQEVQTENQRLKLQLDSMEQQSQLERRKTGEERSNLAQLKDAYTKLFEDYEELKEERKKRETGSAELVADLQARLVSAEQALAAKQSSIDAMKQELYRKEQELETVSVFQAQAEVYSSDFYAERAAREKIHEERERLAAQLEFLRKQNTQLQEEMDTLGRHSLNEMQRRHVSRGANPHGGAGAQGARGGDAGRDWQQQVNIPEHACPKCNEILPDLDSLQIHIMDCII